MKTLLLSTAYFPPVQYISAIVRHPAVYIEQYENYGKQSYRNRCEILSANGVMPLSVPVKKNNRIKFLLKEAEIDYSTNWQKLHLRGLESAYRNSPFYDYYEEDFLFLFTRQEKFLLDLNNRILHTILQLLNIRKEILYTTDYIRETEGYNDLRNTIHPKSSRRTGETPEFRALPYPQTFCEKFPFFPNLSILDLLFNMGPESGNYL